MLCCESMKRATAQPETLWLIDWGSSPLSSAPGPTALNRQHRRGDSKPPMLKLCPQIYPLIVGQGDQGFFYKYILWLLDKLIRGFSTNISFDCWTSWSWFFLQIYPLKLWAKNISFDCWSCDPQIYNMKIVHELFQNVKEFLIHELILKYSTKCLWNSKWFHTKNVQLKTE